MRAMRDPSTTSATFVAYAALAVEQPAGADDDASLCGENAWQRAHDEREQREGGWTENAAQTSGRGRSTHERCPREVSSKVPYGTEPRKARNWGQTLLVLWLDLVNTND